MDVIGQFLDMVVVFLFKLSSLTLVVGMFVYILAQVPRKRYVEAVEEKGNGDRRVSGGRIIALMTAVVGSLVILYNTMIAFSAVDSELVFYLFSLSGAFYGMNKLNAYGKAKVGSGTPENK